ncbi:MAG TPA: NTP transferase domain-containing protein [Gammaproteobacteria bacterium]
MIPPLFGLVLAGGESRRMGRDKGALVYHAEPQAVHAWRLLGRVCGRAYVSTTARRAATAPYADLPLIVDDEEGRGPAGGLLAAWRRHPDAAWLVLAVDLPLADERFLRELVAARDPEAAATAFVHEDGSIEPLCTIWEPSAREPLAAEMRGGRASPRRVLESRVVALVEPADPAKLRSANAPEEHAAALRALGKAPEGAGF